jgi:hypothetical protein
VPAIVIDTNVLLVANGLASQMSDKCRLACLDRLEKAKRQETVVVDRQNLILDEYHNKLEPYRRPPGPGDAFLLHLLQNMGSSTHVASVDLTPTDAQHTNFEEFPADENLRESFDPADRKFVAASNAHPEMPPIVEAADSKWIGWAPQLAVHGITVEFPCRSELETILAREL